MTLKKIRIHHEGSTPSPRLTQFCVTRNSTSAEFLKTALCGIPLQWNSSKSRYAEFQWNSTTVPLTRFSCNAEFRNSQNVRFAGTRCISKKKSSSFLGLGLLDCWTIEYSNISKKKKKIELSRAWTV